MDVRTQQILARAEVAFRENRLDAARADLHLLLRSAGEQARALHLLALVERRSGRQADARQAFERALAVAPADAQVHTNYANLLGDMGEVDRALSHYDHAIAGAGPVARDALFNRASMLARLARPGDALADLDRVLAISPRHAGAHALRGAALRALGRLDDAAVAFDAALAIEPRPTALQGRARVALERGEAHAAALFQRCIDAGAGDTDVLLGLANAREAEGDPGGIDLLVEATRALPGWIEGHEELARMRAEAGAGDGFAASYVAAMPAQVGNRAFHVSYWKTLARAGRHRAALAAIDRARPSLGDDPAIAAVEASIALEARDRDRAGAVLATLADPGHEVLHARHALATGAPDAAAALLERRVRDHPADMAAWAYLDVAWRLTGDPRWAWLTGQPGLYGYQDLPLSADDLAELADLLRRLHKARAQPIGQSLVGGTQTRGRLFDRLDPPLRRLAATVLAAVNRHLAAHPPHDPSHPQLRHPHPPTLNGSWSARLSVGGFHVSHIHTRGVLSSALYVALPTTGESREGWLELGRPPDALGLVLQPVATIEPQPGRLVLFPSYLFHGTRPFCAGERLSVAFDVTF